MRMTSLMAMTQVKLNFILRGIVGVTSRTISRDFRIIEEKHSRTDTYNVTMVTTQSMSSVFHMTVYFNKIVIDYYSHMTHPAVTQRHFSISKNQLPNSIRQRT